MVTKNNMKIKFRGLGIYLGYNKEKMKTVHIKKWIYGYVILGGGGEFPKTAQIWSENGCNYSVDPKTAGQFTGLYDKNNKEFYKDDIVKFKFYQNGFGSPELVEELIGIIQWDNEESRFRIKTDRGFFKVREKGRNIEELNFDVYDREIIGNIHENPELINK